MPQHVYRGLSEPVLQWQEWNWDPSIGYTLDQEYQGMDSTAMSRLANWYNYYGVNTRIRFQAGRATLITKDATLNYTIDKWEMNVDQLQPSIFENTLFNSLISDTSVVDKVTVLTLLRRALENTDPANASSVWDNLTQYHLQIPNFNSDGTPVLDAYGIPTSSPSKDVNPTAFSFLKNLGAPFFGGAVNLYCPNMVKLKQYINDYIFGVTNFISGRYTLRHTTNAPNQFRQPTGILIPSGPYGWNVADFNVERVYTISQLLSEVQNCNLWILPLPQYLAYKIANYYVPNLNGSNYMWGALKQRSNAVTAANNRVDITTEYIIDQINTNLYPTI